MALQIKEVRGIFLDPRPNDVIAVAYGVHDSTVSRIKNRKSHTPATDGLGEPARYRPPHLAFDQVLAIYKSSRPSSDLAREYDVTRQTINNIRNGRTHRRHTGRLGEPGRPPHNTILTNDEILEIYRSSATQKHLARTYGVSQKTVSLIKNGHSHRGITGHGGSVHH